MQNIPFHIAYLLTKHECVTVPGLGAFVVSPSDKEKASRWGIILPPDNFLRFNTEIKHDDGLLADSIANEKQISTEETIIIINQYVTYILNSLDEGESVHIPNVGTLYPKDNKYLFLPDKTLSCNAFNYGLTGVSLPYLKDLQQQADILPKRKDKETGWIPVSRRLITLSCSIATALLFAFIIPLPLNNIHFDKPDTLYASSIQSPTNGEIIYPKTEIQIQAGSSVSQDNILILRSKAANSVKITRLHYYVIITSSQTQLSAEESLASLRTKGFENAAILHTDEKYRVFTNHFEDKKEAESFLTQFKNDYPEYANAWLLSSLPPSQFE